MCQISNALAQIWHKFANRLNPPRPLENKRRAPLAGGALRGFVTSAPEGGREHRAHPNSQNVSTGTFQPGQPFNPFGLFNGIHIPEAVVRCKDLSPGAKITYGRLARYAGQDGACHPRQETLAHELGVSGRQVRTYLGELIRHQLLRAIRMGLHRPNDYVFLWHTIFNGTDRRGSSDQDRKDTSCQDRKDTSCQDRKGTSTQNRRNASAQERKNTSAPYSRESGQENQVPPADAALAGVSSSSREKLSRESGQEYQSPPADAAVAGVSSSAAEQRLCSSLAPLATGETSQNRPKLERAAPVTLAGDDDDEKTAKQRAPGETPRKEFLLRIAERHPKLDTILLLALVEKDLRKMRISMAAILAYDAEHTTNYAAITNPPGYYRWLVRSVASELAEGLKTGIPAGLRVIETPRCTLCCGGFLVTGEFCTCPLGHDMAMLERRKAEKAAKAEVLYPDSVDTGEGSVRRTLLPPVRQAARAGEA